jgi:hypothetical protein
MRTLRSAAARRLDVVQPNGEWQDEPQSPATPDEIIPTARTLESTPGTGLNGNNTPDQRDTILVEPESRDNVPPIDVTPPGLEAGSPALNESEEAKPFDRAIHSHDVWFEDEEPQRTPVLGLDHVEGPIWKIRI